ITVDTPIKAEYRVKLIINSFDVQLTRSERVSEWRPPKSLEVSAVSSVEVKLKTGYNVAGISFRREVATIEIDVKQAIRQFPYTTDHEVSVSENVQFAHQPANVKAYFRLPPSVRSSLSIIQALSRTLQSES
ncbi:hypothetical protein FRC16_004058, partial [Serendipita sp. 398]